MLLQATTPIAVYTEILSRFITKAAVFLVLTNPSERLLHTLILLPATNHLLTYTLHAHLNPFPFGPMSSTSSIPLFLKHLILKSTQTADLPLTTFVLYTHFFPMQTEELQCPSLVSEAKETP